MSGQTFTFTPDFGAIVDEYITIDYYI
jgi:hypothetical protein